MSRVEPPLSRGVSRKTRNIVSRNLSNEKNPYHEDVNQAKKLVPFLIIVLSLFCRLLLRLFEIHHNFKQLFWKRVPNEKNFHHWNRYIISLTVKWIFLKPRITEVSRFKQPISRRWHKIRTFTKNRNSHSLVY